MNVNINNRSLINTKRIYLNSSQAIPNSIEQDSSFLLSRRNGRLSYNVSDALISCDDDEIMTCSVVNFSTSNGFKKYGQEPLILNIANGQGANEPFTGNLNSDKDNTPMNQITLIEFIALLNSSIPAGWAGVNGSEFTIYGQSHGQNLIGITKAGAGVQVSMIIYGEDDLSGVKPVNQPGTSRVLMRSMGLDPSKSYEFSYDNVGAGLITYNTSNINLGLPTHFLVTSNLVNDSYANTKPALRNVLAQIPFNYNISTYNSVLEEVTNTIVYENSNMIGSHKQISKKNVTQIDLDIRMPWGELADFNNSDYNIELEFKTLSRYRNDGGA